MAPRGSEGCLPHGFRRYRRCGARAFAGQDARGLGRPGQLDTADKDRTGRFRAVLGSRAKVEDGKLVLDGLNASLFATARTADSFHFRAAVGNLGDTIPFYHKGPYSVMCLPRELYAGPEGQLYQRPVDEVTAAHARSLFQLDKPRDLAAGFALQPPANYMLQCSVQLDPRAMLSINMRQQPDPGETHTLSLRPKSQEAALTNPGGGGGGKHCKMDTGKPIKIQVFVQGSVIECFINDQVAITTRSEKYPKGMLSLKAEGGKANLLDLTVKAQN